jgi:hypothetical protein
MKIAIRKESNDLIYIDKTALNRFSEEILSKPPYNFSLVEIEKEDCEATDFNDDLTFNIDKYNKRKNNLSLKNELSELENWFEKYFQPQLIQSMWQTNFKISKDIHFKDENGEFKTYLDIEELKQQGEIVRTRIKEIRGLTNVIK